MLSRQGDAAVVRVRASDEMMRRRLLAEEYRDAVLNGFVELEGAVSAPTLDATREALARGAAIIVRPRVSDDLTAHRRASVHALIRLGRRDERFVYAPLLVKNSEVVESSTTRQLLQSDLAQPSPAHATMTPGVCVRSTVSLTRSGIVLAHATRVLQAQGYGDENARVALVDRQRRVWWLELAGSQHPRFNLATYDALYRERRELLAAFDRWTLVGGEFPTQPYWHRECEDCEFREHCRGVLDVRDDVSLTHYTNFEQQRLLHEFGVDTRRDLAGLDPERARLARRTPSDSTSREAVLGLAIERLDDLIYRARVHTSNSLLRRVEGEDMGCPRADVEVDVDMESDGERTYLWGAYVRVAAGATLEGVREGYHAFVSWEEPSAESEARVFAEFWAWFAALRDACAHRSLSFAAYCFWAQAEDGAMNRAVATGGGPSAGELEEFRSHSPSQWIDLHEHAKAQVQTEGPLGLKVLARAAGFDWRDENPSGEASMASWRRRILEYNEDDCRATQALRDWLNGAARDLAHRDGPGPW